MSLHFILDGYNIIKRSDFLATQVLKDGRRELVRFISEKKPCGSSNNKVTVVFDGAEDLDFPRQRDNKGIEVIFTPPLRAGAGFTSNSSADERIKKIVKESRNPKRIVVVSDDREIQFTIRSYGAQIMTVAEFIQKGNPSLKIPQNPPKIELTYQEIAKINRELKQVWLK